VQRMLFNLMILRCISLGIKFSLPLKPDMMFVGEFDVDDCPVEFQPADEDQTLDLDHDEWLRDIGISPRRTLKLST